MRRLLSLLFLLTILGACSTVSKTTSSDRADGLGTTDQGGGSGGTDSGGDGATPPPPPPNPNQDFMAQFLDSVLTDIDPGLKSGSRYIGLYSAYGSTEDYRMVVVTENKLVLVFADLANANDSSTRRISYATFQDFITTRKDPPNGNYTSNGEELDMTGFKLFQGIADRNYYRSGGKWVADTRKINRDHLVKGLGTDNFVIYHLFDGSLLHYGDMKKI